MIPLEESLQIGLILLATAAGAPFIPKLVQGAKGNVGAAVGLMFLIMVVTIFYLPLVLPLLLPGVEVDPREIAKSLIVTMLIPLVIAMLIRSHSPDVAAHWAPVMNKLSSVAVLILLVAGIGMNLSNILGFIGTRGIGALVLLFAGALAIGLLFGGRNPGIRTAMGLSTGNRNGAAAILVAGLNFAGTDTLPFLLVGVHRHAAGPAAGRQAPGRTERDGGGGDGASTVDLRRKIRSTTILPCKGDSNGRSRR